MIPITDLEMAQSHDHAPITLSTRVKEAFFMALIFFMGFSGLSLCIEKVYPIQSKEFQDLIIHDSDLAQIDI